MLLCESEKRQKPAALKDDWKPSQRFQTPVRKKTDAKTKCNTCRSLFDIFSFVFFLTQLYSKTLTVDVGNKSKNLEWSIVGCV